MTVGLWLIGARGSLATTVVTGLSALSAGVAGEQGLVTALDDFAEVPLVGFGDIVTGGHDVSEMPLRKRAEELASAGVFPYAILTIAADALDSAEGRIRHGILQGEAPRAAIERVQADLREFRQANGLDDVVVVNVASTEGMFANLDAHTSLGKLDVALDAGEGVLPPSSLYAYAAIDAGFPFVDFTPSTGARLPALEQLAVARGVPHAGSDGKTGETLVKTALAPMFLSRNLRVRSWAGLNLLGGGDGLSLSEPDRAASKLESKARSLDESLGYETTHPVHIDYLEDMGQWKTAWNHISFEGFMGTAMKLQFTWEGCDSALAAPLVIDLARLTALAHSSGKIGALPELAFFFKDPVGTEEHRLGHQFHQLVAWANQLGKRV